MFENFKCRIIMHYLKTSQKKKNKTQSFKFFFYKICMLHAIKIIGNTQNLNPPIYLIHLCVGNKMETGLHFYFVVCTIHLYFPWSVTRLYYNLPSFTPYFSIFVKLLKTIFLQYFYNNNKLPAVEEEILII